LKGDKLKSKVVYIICWISCLKK